MCLWVRTRVYPSTSRICVFAIRGSSETVASMQSICRWCCTFPGKQFVSCCSRATTMKKLKKTTTSKLWLHARWCSSQPKQLSDYRVKKKNRRLAYLIRQRSDRIHNVGATFGNSFPSSGKNVQILHGNVHHNAKTRFLASAIHNFDVRTTHTHTLPTTHKIQISYLNVEIMANRQKWMIVIFFTSVEANVKCKRFFSFRWCFSLF